MEIENALQGIREFRIGFERYRIEDHGLTCHIRHLQDDLFGGSWQLLGISQMDFESNEDDLELALRHWLNEHNEN